MTRNQKRIIVLSFVFALVACLFGGINYSYADDNNNNNIIITEQQFHTAEQHNALVAPDPINYQWPDGKQEKSNPQQIQLTHEFKDWRDGEWSNMGSMFFRKVNDPNAGFVEVKGNANWRKVTCNINNLQLNTDYEFFTRMYIYDQIKCPKDSEIKKLRIESCPPCNKIINGVVNARDVGGWKTLDGSVIKQGLIYRTGRLDGVNDDGVRILKDNFGIKHEIDYRELKDRNTKPSGRIGSTYHMFSINPDVVRNFYYQDDAKNALRESFKLFANQDNLPLLFHCSVGTDRTGYVAFMLDAFLGMGHDDLVRDYMFSTFSNLSKSRDPKLIDFYIDGLYAMDNDSAKTGSLSDHAAAYLRSIGVTDEELANIKNIMLEQA